jgi:hypothetical protein
VVRHAQTGPYRELALQPARRLQFPPVDYTSIEMPPVVSMNVPACDADGAGDRRRLLDQSRSHAPARAAAEITGRDIMVNLPAQQSQAWCSLRRRDRARPDRVTHVRGARAGVRS